MGYLWVAGDSCVLLLVLWKPLINITVHADLAAVEGVRVSAVRTALMLITALVIAIAMKIVGVLLITALLIIPAATARRVSNTPEQMAVTASVIAMLTVLDGAGYVLVCRYTRRAVSGSLRAHCCLLFSAVSSEELALKPVASDQMHC